jgi:uncharacterized protein (UPF0264 family)
MAKTKPNIKKSNSIFETDILDKIFVQSTFYKPEGKSIFISQNLDDIGEKIHDIDYEVEGIKYKEWQNYKLAVYADAENVKVTLLNSDITHFKTNLRKLERAYINNFFTDIENILEDIIKHGQELLRRKYFAHMLNTDKKIIISKEYQLILDSGAKAIQMLGRAPDLPLFSYRKYSKTGKPRTASLGIEILSSGAFPDWDNKYLRMLKKSGKVKAGGFENVIEAALDTPRSRVIKKALSENKDILPLFFPVLMRTMLDLELMRLGQATTPGNFKMLLNSYYHGAGIVDHSTNVSEQVQIIYAEENWKPAYTINAKDNPKRQAETAAKILLTEYFRFKSNSPVSRDHPRIARIQFNSNTNTVIVTQFFAELQKLLITGIRINNKVYKINKAIHKILPVIELNNYNERLKIVKTAIDSVKNAGLKELAIIAGYTRHYPGLLQYFEDENETNEIIKYSVTRKLKLTDGKSVDMVATSNKAIEAAAGAMMSGQGCVKVGLLGLTNEQMVDFIRQVKKGLQSALKRVKNQLLIFIGLVDEPLVSDKKVYTNGREIALKFAELMKQTRHDILLLDTMHKGKNDKRFVSEKDINKSDTKGGHLTFSQLKSLIAKANKWGCDIWVAGSYTEEQVYQASLEKMTYRPGLICLGGAERSFGGIRLDPSDAYEPITNNEDEQKLSAVVQMDSDIKFVLSRDNKLARDAGHTTGELHRKGFKKEARALKLLRSKYLKARGEYYAELSNEGVSRKVLSKNIDTLINTGSKWNASKLKKKRVKFLTIRESYVNKVSGHMYDLFKNEWFQ